MGMYLNPGNQAFAEIADQDYVDKTSLIGLINKTIGKKAPNVYFQEARKQCETGKIVIGSITNMEQLLANLRTNCIPEDVFEMDHTDYETFLEKRRLMMAQKIHAYYEAL